MPNCLFCDIIAGKIPSRKVYEDDRVYAFEDIKPGAPTHVLIIPKAHIVDLKHAQPQDAEIIGYCSWWRRKSPASAASRTAIARSLTSDRERGSPSFTSTCTCWADAISLGLRVSLSWVTVAPLDTGTVHLQAVANGRARGLQLLLWIPPVLGLSGIAV